MNECPECGADLPADRINIQEGVAHCPRCGKVSRLSEVAEVEAVPDADLSRPPHGCAYLALGQDVEITVSCRSLKSAIPLLAISLFWNGIVSVFLSLALGSLYTRVVGPLPSWVPGPITAGGSMPLAMSIVLAVFLIPFVLIGLAMIGAFLTSLAGSVTITLSGYQGKVRTGVGPIRSTRRFDIGSVKKVAITESVVRGKNNDIERKAIVIEADRTITFGSTLTHERRLWLAAALRELLMGGKN